jgi:hypothetical protein
MNILIFYSILSTAALFVLGYFISKYWDEIRKARVRSSGQVTLIETPMYEYYVNRKAHFEGLPLLPDDIVFVGDSMVECCEFSELFPGYPVKNRGICGEMIMRVEERVPDITKGQSRKIFFRLGMVDILHSINQEKLVASYTHMLQTVLAASPFTTVYVMSLQPAAEKFKVANPRVLDLNRQMAEICATNDRLIYIDLFPFFEDSQGQLRRELTMDGVHINAAGYAIWQRELVRYFD